MNIEALLSEASIALNLELSSKQEAISAVLELVDSHEHVLDHTLLVEDVMKREHEMSTGIGKNIGLPHAKTAAVSSPLIAMVTIREGIDFDSIDGQPVQLVFLLATPDSMLAEHLKLLGRITRLVGRDEVRQRIINSSSAAEVLSIFREEEKDLPQI